MEARPQRIRASAARIGMKLANDVFSPTGSVIVNKGEVLTAHLLHKIRMHNVEHLYVILGQHSAQEEYKNINRKALNQFTQVYKKTEAQVKSSMQNICKGEEVDRDCLIDVTHQVMKSIEDPKEILKYLYATQLEESSIFTHSVNVSILSNLLGTWLNYSVEEVKELTIAALLHDIGKTTNTYDKVHDYKLHPQLGYDMLKKQGFSEAIAQAVLLHHENLDGTGFPLKVKWNDITEYARIVAIANYYDNKTTGGKTLQERPDPYKILQLLEADRFTRFDINYVNTFMSKIAHYYLNAWVRLSDGRKAQIVFINNYALASPIVEVDGELINLYSRSDLKIDQVLQ
ncbi:HD domain-containing protein [Heliorestis acidaminivorans]|uniref:HD domain-containing protein n=1 Tax=Heliorestis acidaminivorans TaxID=553427 RepID=A0A6I0ER42_9FIRM|nr:HD domain-containing phosphohydrolase [Heliorestis acidaminivorans]KAB2952716.1 HD domain-containing protein [Heliorestis acidaminivorans]